MTQEALLAALRERYYEAWQLRDIGLWQGGYNVEPESMYAIARSIPSLRTLWGSGEKHLPIALHTNPFP
jgi:hypothetical protein